MAWTLEAALGAVETQGGAESESACRWLLEQLHPVACLYSDGGAGDQPVVQLDTVKALAKQYGGLITRLLKALSGRLASSSQQSGEGSLAACGQLCCSALQSLDVLRPVLKSSATDLEVQRYGFIRKLAAAGLHEPALHLGLSLFSHLRPLTALPTTQPQRGSGQPPHAAAPTPAVVHELLSAAVTTMLVCAAELSSPAPQRLGQLMAMVEGPVQDFISMLRCVGACASSPQSCHAACMQHANSILLSKMQHANSHAVVATESAAQAALLT